MRTPVLTAAILLAVSGSSRAWVSERGERAVEPAAGYELAAERVLDRARQAPSGWHATSDRATGRLTQLWGGHVHVPGANTDPAIAEAAARAFVAANLAQLAGGMAIADLVTVANRVDGGVRTVAFQQRWRGLRVVGGQLHVVFARDRLFALDSRLVPDVAIAVPPRGRVSAVRAQAWVRAAHGAAVVVASTGERVVLPVRRGATRDVRVAEVLDARAVAGDAAWEVYVDADGAPIARVGRNRYATGELRYDVGVRRPTGTRASYPVADTSITVDAAPTTTDGDGAFTWPGTSAATVEPGLLGAAVRIINEAGALATAQLTAQPGQPVVWSLANDPFGDAQLSAYVHVALGKARARRMLPTLTWLDQPLDVHVNDDGTCNAMSTGTALHFYGAGPTCENTARLADVVYHELGHALHFQALIPGAGMYQASLSEGLSDFFAANLVDDPGVGRGFTFDDAPVRDLDPPGYERVWPADRDPSPHLTGLIVAGALWDLRKNLIAQLGEPAGVAAAEAIYVGIVQRAADLPGSYLAALIADDDDGDLGNGTPHGCAIEAAFGKHGLAESTFQTTTVGVPSIDQLTITVPVVVPTGTSCAPPQVTAVRVAWRVEGTGGASGTLELSTTATATGATWTGALPAPADHTVVRYEITATLDDLSSVHYPTNLADPAYQVYVGTPLPIWCDALDVDPQWTTRGAASWDWAMPGTGAASGDPAVAYTGTHVLGTTLVGEGRYPRSATTSIESPPLDVASYDQVRLQYRRWLTIEDGSYDQATITVHGTPVWSNLAQPATPLAHLDREWRFHDVDLTPHVRDGTMQVSWELVSDDAREHGGWTIDDVCVVGIGKHARCGDGVLDDGEACDDANLTDGDGCADSCTLEDDAGCCSTGGDPTSPIGLALGVGALAWIHRRRARR